MREISFLRGVIVCVAALEPLSPIWGHVARCLSWIDFAYSSGIAYYRGSFGFGWPIKFTCLCAFICLSVAAQARSALIDLRQGAIRGRDR